MWQFLLLVSSLLAMETFQNQFICEFQEFETKKKNLEILENLLEYFRNPFINYHLINLLEIFRNLKKEKEKTLFNTCAWNN
jgi:hypothetical protein